MIEADITAKRIGSVYEVHVNLGKYTPSLKWDTGAKYTVISARMLDDDISDEALRQMKDYCEEHLKHKERFISASGDPFYGYLSHAKDVVVGNTVLHDFYYYLVFENKRDIALLGFDFIENCKGFFDAHSDIIVKGFDADGYKQYEGALETNELISLIDSLSNSR